MKTAKKSDFGPLLLVADWSDLKIKKKVLEFVQGNNISKAHPNRFDTG